jgi:hypothetical protein
LCEGGTLSLALLLLELLCTRLSEIYACLAGLGRSTLRRVQVLIALSSGCSLLGCAYVVVLLRNELWGKHGLKTSLRCCRCWHHNLLRLCLGISRNKETRCATWVLHQRLLRTCDRPICTIYLGVKFAFFLRWLATGWRSCRSFVSFGGRALHFCSLLGCSRAD